MILEHIEEFLRKEAEARLETPTNPFRASASGRCIREGCFDLLGVKGKPLQPRRLLTLMNGSVIHDDLLTPLLHKALGWRFIEDVEGGTFEIDGAEISYHIDGAFQNDENICSSGCNSLHPQVRIGIIEIKSMSDFAFNRALKGEIDHDYLCQAWCYFKGTDFNPVVFLAYRKETSAMVEIIFDRTTHEKVVTQRLTGNPIELAKKDPILMTEIRSPFDESVEEYVKERIKWLQWTAERQSLASFPDTLKAVPGADAVEDEVENIQGSAKAQARAKELGISCAGATQSGSWWKLATGRKILGFPCSYCAHMERCYPTAEMEIKGDRPIWVV